MDKIPLSPLLLALNRIAHVAHTSVFGQFLSLPDMDYENQRVAISTVIKVAQEIGLPATLEAAGRYSAILQDHGTRPNPGLVTYSVFDAGRLEDLGNDVCGRASAEMGNRIALLIPHAKAPYYDPPVPIFGKDVADKFPNYTTDMFEAGNCFALGRNTACVFHLMRIMEAAVQAFGNKLGVAHATQSNWQKILDDLNAPIKAIPRTDPLRPTYSAIHANLYHVKVAWRNEVMHPKATYDEPEARGIINAVQAFLNDIRIL